MARNHTIAPARQHAKSKGMTAQILLLGQTLTFDGAPLEALWQDCAHIDSEGGVLIEGTRIAAVGNGAALKAAHPRARCVSYGDDLIVPGFIDAHAHYPQTAMIASWGKRLIEWLNTYTFPEETRFADAQYADRIADRYLDLTRAHGTTTIASFGTIHPHSADALFAAAAARGQAVVTGKTCMDRNAPDDLRDTAQSAYDDSKALIAHWHGEGRARYAITPRFSPTSTPEQLAALGALWSEHPDCLMQTHLSEQPDEVAWVRDLYPQARDYLDTYEAHGLLGARGLYGHAIHLEPREIDRLAEVRGALVHCPTSNAFIVNSICRAWQRATFPLALPPTPAAVRHSRCCAPWQRPMKRRSTMAPPCMRHSSCGWRLRAPRGHCTCKTRSGRSHRVITPTSP